MPDFAVGFAAPWVLLLLPLLLLLPAGRGRWLRALALALLLVALAQPRLARPYGQVAVLVDVSDSVGDNARELAAAFAYDELSRPPLFYYFAGDAGAVDDLSVRPSAALERGESDLARALQVAAAGGARRVLLLSDGAESRGEALLALPGVPVDALAVPSRANARLVDLVAPDRASPGETVEVVAVVESDRATRATLNVTVGDTPLPPVERELPAGQASIPFRFQVRGDQPLRVAATLEVDFPQPLRDDALVADIAVAEEEPVLVIDDPALSTLLRAQGFTVIDGSAAEVVAPLPYSAVVLRDDAGQFTPGQLEELRDYVERGGGLMMTGGPQSFGFGAWYRTPVEEVLPVNTDLRTEVSLPLVALVIVLDRSQSMSTGNPSKIDLAKEGAISVVELAYQDDLLGLLVFSDAESSQWVFGLRPATERGKREMLGAILGITTQGGTVLEPAYAMALEALTATEAAVKHVIILSDGKLYDGQGPFAADRRVDFGAMAAAGLAQRITTSTIAVGEAADFERLEALAAAGGGRYYQALDASTLPQIFTNEALTATRSLLRDEPLTPAVRRHPLLPEGVAPPPVSAYVATTLKGDAEMLLEGIDGEPLLAVRRQGLGRTAALTTDLNAWAGEFGAWPQLPAVLGTVTRWLQARPAEFALRVEREGAELEVVVDAVKNGEYVNNRELTLRYQGSEAPLEQVAPGRYQGRVAAGDGEGTLLVVDGEGVVARTRISTPVPEFDVRGAGARLAAISARSGGELLAEPGVYAPPAPARAAPLWPLAALLALALLLLELAYRRFGGGRAEAA